VVREIGLVERLSLDPKWTAPFSHKAFRLLSIIHYTPHTSTPTMVIRERNATPSSKENLFFMDYHHGQTPRCFFITGAGGGIYLFVSGAFPQNLGLDFETSYLNTKGF